METVTINLHPGGFTQKGNLILEAGEFSVRAFVYSTGVLGLAVNNAAGGFELLPYQGQQIWRAHFSGEELKMRTSFAEPEPTRDFLATYGAFLLHCGATAMGNPAEGDTHPQHGELPNIPYDRTYVKLGCDKEGDYICAGGFVRVRNAFSFDYTANPEVRLYAGESVMHITMGITNNRENPMQYMYLCHINFRPRDGAQLIYSAPADAAHVKVFHDIPAALPEEKASRLAACMETIISEPSRHHKIGESWQCYDPEIVMAIDYHTDKDGWGHCMQYSEKGADYAAFRKAELPAGIRWISRTGDEDAMGMLLPATGDHKGRAAALQSGQIKELPSHGSVEFACRAGWLPSEKATEMKFYIERHLGGIYDNHQ
jgi:hypothetical protein